MFENVDGRTTDTDDGRTPDPWVSYKLTGEPSAQVSSKYTWVNLLCVRMTINFKIHTYDKVKIHLHLVKPMC